ncbi:hypothetical protein [Streptomyces sp. NPDC013457]|uniref:hypothetical protein n=1 Tax=Streptomyces sp. NPDC013457 TaxID=3364866 RepID=UPI0036FFF714
MTAGRYDEGTDESQGVELDGPDLAGFYTSQLHDWIPLCPYLSDSAVRLYWILRALVIEKHGPVRKLTLLQIAYLLPRKPVLPGEAAEQSSIGRIRDLMRLLTRARLLTTPEGKEIKTSSRASAASRPLRIRIHDRPGPGYTGPRNAFALLDAVKGPAEEAARKAVAREAERAAKRRAEKAGWKSNPTPSAEGPGWISNPLGQISNPLGWKSNPDSAADLQDRFLPLSPPAQSSRSASAAPVRPSVQVVEAHAKAPDGRTDGGGGIVEDQKRVPVAAGEDSAAAGAAPENDGSNGGRGAASGSGAAVRPVERTPGVDVLLAVAAEDSQWKINHADSLRDQGRTVTGMLEVGFTAQEIRHALLSRPLPSSLRTTVAAVVGRRLKDLVRIGASAGIQPIPAQQAGEYDAARPEAEGREHTAVPAAWADRRAQMEVETAGAGRHRPCAGDGGLCPRLARPGSDLCSTCLTGEQPTCAAGCRRGVIDHTTVCITCAAPQDSEGACPGHGGKQCGRPVVSEGWCRRCRFEAEAARQAADAEWEAARDAAIAAAEAEEPHLAPI